jgi:dipeptidyl aminopeptidase/acylaminoacyl peptidase
MKSVVVFLIALIALTACKNNSADNTKGREIKQYTIEQFYKSSNTAGGTFSLDGTKLLVSSNESGIYNAYEIDIASGQQKALTNSSSESVFAVSYVPGSLDFLFASDKGGNENDHLFLRRTDGTTKELTTGENEKADFLRWAKNNTSFYYTSNLRDPRFFDLYRMDTGSWRASMIFKNDQGYQIEGISDEGQYLALVRPITTSTGDLFLADMQSGSVKKINSDEAPSMNGFQDLSSAEKKLYYTTDEGSEFQYVMQYDIATGKKEKIYTAPWDVMYMRLSKQQQYRVIGVNEDGRNKIYLFNHASGEAIEFPKLEDGNVQDVSVSADEKRMRLTIGDSKSPNNIFVYDFATKELKRLTNTLNPEIDANDLVAAEVVRFRSFDSLEIPAIFYKPLQAGNNNKVPAMIWVHGGPGGQTRVGYFALIQYLVNHGYAILAVNNRGSSGYGKTFNKLDNRNHGDKDLKDCIAGKDFLAGLPYIDSSKIGIMGGSYGGYMTLAGLAFHPEAFKVGVDIFGVANWLRTLREIPPYWESFKTALYEEIGDPNTADTVRLKQYSPLLHASNINKPLMVLQGANDPRVLKVESDEIVASVKKNNVPVSYTVFPDEGHGFLKKENEIKGYGQILEFLDQHLKGNKTNGTLK